MKSRTDAKHATRRGVVGRRLGGPLELGIFAEAPLLFVGWLAWFDTGHGGSGDFAIFRAAGSAVLHGQSPYVKPTLQLLAQNDRYVYPTPFAYPFAPFALIPERLGALLFLLLSVAALVASLRLLGVRDWRCYGATFLGAPVFGALGVGAIGPLLLLLVAAGWRVRRTAWVGVLFALAAAAKLFLWPLLVWLIVTRRSRACFAALATIAVIVLIWAVADPSGLARYPRTVQLLNQAERWKSYSPQTLALSLGASPAIAVLVPLVIAVVGAALIAAARSDRRALAAAIGVALLASPLLWLHYLVLLLVPVSLYSRRLSAVWLAPVLLWLTPHPESLGSVWRIAVVLTATTALTAIALRLPASSVTPAAGPSC